MTTENGPLKTRVGSTPLLTGNRSSDLVSEGMCERKVVNVWKGWLYCIEFRKP
jgi:hypothetical protein